MKIKVAALAAGVGLMIGALPVLAHHSFAAEYDNTKPITLKGTFVKMDWTNPHSWVYFTVTDENGKVADWRAETPPPNALVRNGWRVNMIKPGEQMTVRGYLAKDGSNLMFAQNVTLSDGRVIGLGSSPEIPGQKGKQ
jgi:Family of unknown function (DUF6152)